MHCVQMKLRYGKRCRQRVPRPTAVATTWSPTPVTQLSATRHSAKPRDKILLQPPIAVGQSPSLPGVIPPRLCPGASQGRQRGVRGASSSRGDPSANWTLHNGVPATGEGGRRRGVIGTSHPPNGPRLHPKSLRAHHSSDVHSGTRSGQSRCI